MFIIKRIVYCLQAINSSIISRDISKHADIILELLLGLLQNYMKVSRDGISSKNESIIHLGIFPPTISLISSLISPVSYGGHGLPPLSVAAHPGALQSIVAAGTDVLEVNLTVNF